MKFSQNGYDFTDEDEEGSFLSPLKSANDYCKEKKVKARVFIVSKGSFKKFLLFNKMGEPIFEDSQLEGILCHIDMMALAQEE